MCVCVFERETGGSLVIDIKFTDKSSLCLSLPPSLSLSHTHTHTPVAAPLLIMMVPRHTENPHSSMAQVGQ